MTKYTEKTYILLTTLSKIFDSQIFDIHRDTIAKLLHTDNRIVTQCMRSLKGKHGMIDFNMTDEREYTVTLIKPSQYIYGNFMKYSQEDIKKMDGTNIDNYKKMLEEQKMREEETQHEGLQRFLEEKRKEQIDNGNKAENALKAVFDELGIKYDYQHIEIIKDDEGKEHGYIYDFFVVIDGKKYDVEIDGSSHDGNEERDKERDKLTRSIGIEPIRFSTQMIYAIAFEVNKGKLNKNDILLLIVNDYSSIAELWERKTLFYNRWIDCKEENKRLQNSLIEEKDKRIQDLIKVNKSYQDLIEEYKKLQNLLDVKTIQLSEAKYSISELNAILDDIE